MIYLDNSATTRQYDEVTDLMYKVSRENFGNPSSLYRLGIDAENIIDNARKEIGKHFKLGEIYFTASGTEGDNTAVFGSFDKMKKRGKRIITTLVEHPAVMEPMNRLLELGYDVEYISVDKNCNLNMDELKSKLTEDTILISIMAVNNEIGTIMPINEIADLRDKVCPKAIFHSDCVQALGKLDLSLLNADIMTCSAHKIHGPKGVGSIFIKKGLNISPYLIGGGQERGFRSATENVPGIAGYGLATKMAYTDFDNRVKKIGELRDLLKDGLTSSLKDVVINTPTNSVCSVLSASFLGTRGEVILHSLEEDGIYVSTGSACNSNHGSKGSRVLNMMGLSKDEISGTIRFSLSEFTREEDIEFTIDKVKASVNRFRKLGTFR